MICIYVHGKPLFLVDRINDEIETYLQRPETLFIDELTTYTVQKMLDELEGGKVCTGVLFHTDLSKGFEVFQSHFVLVKAAGGFVYTPGWELLLIFRRGKWDLPKGKLDEGEGLESCALREVKEETGVKELKIVEPLNVTYHTYHEGRQHILKESHWFLMKMETAAKLTPQTEEDIEKCKWVSFTDLSEYTDNMHASIVDVVNHGKKRLKLT